MNIFFEKVWGEAVAFLDRSRKIDWVDLIVVLGIGGLLFGMITLAGNWTGAARPLIEINLHPLALIPYTFYSLCRGMLAYALSLLFTLVYGYWAAKDPLAGRVLVPLLDILQSIPVLGFMPGVVLALVALFPSSNIGLELASVIMIFTGQVWNMTFSFYQSLRAVPQDMKEVAKIYGFNWRQQLRWMEIPFAMSGLVWNSMMSMAGGWFFLMISEAFVLGNKDFRLPGIGSYMSVAVAKGNVSAMLWAILAMVTMIILLDQLLWRPVVVWAQKFNSEESGRQEIMSSWALDFFRRSRLIAFLHRIFIRGVRKLKKHYSKMPVLHHPSPSPFWTRWVSLIIFSGLLIFLALGGLKLLFLIHSLSLLQWGPILSAALLTLMRVLTATALGTLWAVPAGLAIGLSPRLSRIFQPLVQIAASFPAPMLFPAAIAGLKMLNISLGWGSILLMLLGTQWYILFNVIAGAMAIPSDLREAAFSYRIGRWQKFTRIHLPAIFPYLVTGWVSAAGGAWNASIVSEYVSFHGKTIAAPGLGAYISTMAEKADFTHLAAGIMMMSTVVVLFNRLVWRSCYQLAEQRYSLNK